MRLSFQELEVIVRLKDKHFGSLSKIYLFGSRVCDEKKGGDIDLYIELKRDENLYENKINFLSDLEIIFGEQKIDVVLSAGQERLIDSEAKRGIELDLNKIKLEKYFGECDKHLQRIEEAFDDLSETIPFTAQSYTELKKCEVQAMDQYLFRFAKLQDTIGDRIFKIIGSLYSDSGVAKPFIDTLNLLEKQGFIYSAKEWVSLRNIRNEISHQYDDEPEAMSLAMNTIVIQKDVIKKIYLDLKSKYNEL